MKISYLLTMSLLSVLLTMNNASAKCEDGLKPDQHIRNSCVKEATCKPCPDGMYYRNKYNDCTKCEQGYMYNMQTKSCEK